MPPNSETTLVSRPRPNQEAPLEPAAAPPASPPRLIRSRRRRWLELNPSYFASASADLELSGAPSLCSPAAALAPEKRAVNAKVRAAGLRSTRPPSSERGRARSRWSAKGPGRCADELVPPGRGEDRCGYPARRADEPGRRRGEGGGELRTRLEHRRRGRRRGQGRGRCHAGAAGRSGDEGNSQGAGATEMATETGGAIRVRRGWGFRLWAG